MNSDRESHGLALALLLHFNTRPGQEGNNKALTIGNNIQLVLQNYNGVSSVLLSLLYEPLLPLEDIDTKPPLRIAPTCLRV
jgi:hypothetical protein